MIINLYSVLLGAVGPVSATVASTFTPPCPSVSAPTFMLVALTRYYYSPTDTSTFYVGASNGSLTNTTSVAGKVFDRFIQIWLENTDFNQAQSNAVFQNLSTQGILLTSYYGVTHPSEPNYIASIGGSFFGLGDDDLTFIPNNMSTIIDLLDQKGIGWATYQENMPRDGFPGYNFTNPDNYTYYARKHNPLVIYDSVGQNTTREQRIRNFNDFAYDVNNNTLPQWMFVTPNLRDDGHDTTIEYAGDWLNYWLVPLLKNSNFNTDKTLILLTFDENETYDINNQVYTLLLGGVIPSDLQNTTDDTFYTHYSILSTVQNNWGLGNLGRQDTNQTVANVFAFVAKTTSYENNDLTTDNLPLLNLTGTFPGPLNPDMYVPYLAPNASAVGAGGGPTFVASNVNMSLNASTAPTPVNLSSSSTTTSSARVGTRADVLGVVGAILIGILV